MAGDLDESGIRGAIGSFKNLDVNGKSISVFDTERNFMFNDPSIDRTQLQNMEICDLGLHMLNDENIAALMEHADANPSWNLLKDTYRVYQNSKTGQPWDFSSTYLLPAVGIDPKKKVPDGDKMGGFFLFGSGPYAFNVNDSGNWLWGRAMGRMKVRLSSALGGAHVNSMLIDRAGPDTESDQRAIGFGFIYPESGKPGQMHQMFIVR